VLVSETTAALPFPSDAPFLFSSMAFGLECLSVTHEAARNQGLESQCNLLLAYIAGLCAVASGINPSPDLSLYVRRWFEFLRFSDPYHLLTEMVRLDGTNCRAPLVDL
jgi:hypothetical protein